MKIRRGDTIMFNYVPSQLKQLPLSGHLTGRAVVQKVLRQNGTAVVEVWNGRVCCPVKDQYDEIEVSLDEVHLCKKRSKK